MTYLKYSNLCADMLRASLKEPAKTAAKARETIYYRSSLWQNGAPGKQGEFLCHAVLLYYYCSPSSRCSQLQQLPTSTAANFNSPC